MITLTLENIRCFNKHKFTFTDDAFTLISGPSGVGKSTLFLSIAFAITGESKYLCSKDKRKCQVTLSTCDITIIRSKGPNKLVVKVNDNVYEEKLAQSYIDQTFPNFELGYVPQKYHKSFLAKTPGQKLEFIESFALDQEYLNKLITNCKALLNERKNTHLKSQQHLSTCENMLIRHNIKKVTENPCEDSIETLQEQISQTTDKLKQCTKDIVITRERYSQREEAQLIYDNLVAKVPLSESIENIKTLLKETNEKELQWSKYQDTLTYFNTLTVPQKIVNLSDLRLELNTLTNVINIKERINEKQTRLQELKENLLSLSSLPLDISLDTVSKLEVTLKDYVKAYNHTNKIEDVTVQLKVSETELNEQNKLTERYCFLSKQLKLLDLRRELLQLEDKKTKLFKVQQCPHCMKLISIWNETLIKCSEDNVVKNKNVPDIISHEQQAAIDKKIQALKVSIQIEEQHPDYVEPTTSRNVISCELTKVRNKQLSSRDISKLETRVHDLQNVLSEISRQSSLKETLLDTLRQEFQITDDPLMLTRNISKIKDVILEIHDLTKITEDFKDQLSYHTKNLSLNLSLDEVTQLIKITEPYIKAQEMVQIYKCSPPEHKSNVLEQNLYDKIRLEEVSKVLENNVPDYNLEDLCALESQLQENLKSLKTIVDLKYSYNMWVDVKIAKDSITRAEIDLTRSHKLQALISEAKKEALHEFLDKMTMYTQMYLDEFFSEPISIEITLVDNKVILTLTLHDTKMDLDALSGGEFARVNLAITLALAEIYQIDLLLMDESLASLDHATSTKVLKTIKNLYKGTILCIAHQTVTGTFDHCIELK